MNDNIPIGVSACLLGEAVRFDGGHKRLACRFRARHQELAQLIDRYRQGMQPLLAPIAQLKHYMAEYPDSYLAEQRYFEPYPEVLLLRYGH